MPEYVPASELVEARLHEISMRFGDRLSVEQIAQVRGRVERALKLANAMRATPLTNADEPEIVFAPIRAGR